MRNPLLVVALAAVFATAAAAVEVGQAAPNFKFDKSWNALEKIADKYPATPAGKEAAELLKSYQE